VPPHPLEQQPRLADPAPPVDDRQAPFGASRQAVEAVELLGAVDELHYAVQHNARPHKNRVGRASVSRPTPSASAAFDHVLASGRDVNAGLVPRPRAQRRHRTEVPPLRGWILSAPYANRRRNAFIQPPRSEILSANDAMRS
jgi:hypothetical protein